MAVFDIRNHQLDGEQMQVLAKEINFQESTFITKSDDSNYVYEVRIFTPEIELAFAGHPTIGKAWVIKNLLNLTKPKSLTLALPIGNIAITEDDDLLWLTDAKSEFLEDYNTNEITLFTNLSKKVFAINLPIKKYLLELHLLLFPCNLLMR